MEYPLRTNREAATANLACAPRGRGALGLCQRPFADSARTARQPRGPQAAPALPPASPSHWKPKPQRPAVRLVGVLPRTLGARDPNAFSTASCTDTRGLPAAGRRDAGDQSAPARRPSPRVSPRSRCGAGQRTEKAVLRPSGRAPRARTGLRAPPADPALPGGSRPVVGGIRPSPETPKAAAWHGVFASSAGTPGRLPACCAACGLRRGGPSSPVVLTLLRSPQLSWFSPPAPSTQAPLSGTSSSLSPGWLASAPAPAGLLLMQSRGVAAECGAVSGTRRTTAGPGCRPFLNPRPVTSLRWAGGGCPIHLGVREPWDPGVGERRPLPQQTREAGELGLAQGARSRAWGSVRPFVQMAQ
nr:translation initiation factor IF-2-like [Saimiri boliviensis boliviensis]XP_039332602.1 translation initiation factor IF-2-like [Saimiri boliviensis boliviensis]